MFPWIFPFRSIAKDLGMNDQTLGNWIKNKKTERILQDPGNVN
jgi:transposase-like protein